MAEKKAKSADDVQKFWLRSAILVVLLILVLSAVNMVYEEKVLKQKQIYRQEQSWQDFRIELPMNENGQHVLEFAFFGDSHARDAVYPPSIPGSFNFGTSNEDYVETYYKFVKLLESDEMEIRNIFLEIDLHIFTPNANKDETLFQHLTYYSDFTPLSDISRLNKKNIIGLWLVKHFPVLGHGGELIHILTPPDSTQIVLGWTNQTNDFSKMDRELLTRATILSHFGREDNEEIREENSSSVDLINNRSIDYFLRIIRLAESRGINIIFIRYPVSKYYDDAVTRLGINKQEHYEYLFSLIEKDAGLKSYKVFDYYDIFFEYQRLLDNTDHLNYRGALEFSRILNEDLSRLSALDRTQNKLN
ncbi:hypothetical protein JW868_04685 [Candidatus Woesearchaeota archaeon]|nr:hypothetical protein [Candidatus Woesearchaeota archaeon]